MLNVIENENTVLMLWITDIKYFYSSHLKTIHKLWYIIAAFLRCVKLKEKASESSTMKRQLLARNEVTRSLWPLSVRK